MKRAATWGHGSYGRKGAAAASIPAWNNPSALYQQDSQYGQLLAEGERFVGTVIAVPGSAGWYASNDEITQYLGAEPELLDETGTVKFGDQIEFAVADMSDLQDWSLPIAVDIMVLQSATKMPRTGLKGAWPQIQPPAGKGGLAAASQHSFIQPANASGIRRSSAVAAFKATGGAGFGSAGKFAQAGAVAGKGGSLLGGLAAKTQMGNGKKQVPNHSTKPFERCFIEPATGLAREEVQQMITWREEMAIHVEGESDKYFPPMSSFEEYEELLPQYIFTSLAEQGIEAPMPIQAQALPLALAGENVIGIAKTGSGKTLAYLLPALVHIEAQSPVRNANPIALILAPVRELAVQIMEEAAKLVAHSAGGASANNPTGIRAAVTYGGGSGSKAWQVAEMKKGAHIVAATPGRLADLVESGEVWLNRVTYFVLDEADRMLEEGFADQVGMIASHIRPDRQTLFFSATWPAEVQALAEQMCSGGTAPYLVTVGQKECGGGPTTREDIVQEVVVFDQATWDERDLKKQELLYAHLREVLSDDSHKALVFVSRKDIADTLVSSLQAEGISAMAMHGGCAQDKRLQRVEEFKRGDISLLVTTDVMGRGLDIPNISHVVCYDMGEVSDYVHRIGRTARGPYGKGHALTFFEYDRKWPHLAGELCELMAETGQDVPEDLLTVAQEVENGTREVRANKFLHKREAQNRALTAKIRSWG